MSVHQEIAGRVLEMVGGRAEAQVLVSGGRAALTRFANSFIHQNVGEEQLTVALKVVVEGRTASVSTTQGSDEALHRLVEDALEAARLRPVDPDWPGMAPPAEAPAVEHHDQATEDASPADRASRVAGFVEAAPDLRAAGYCDTEGSVVAYANTSGQRLHGRSTRATLDGIHQTGTSAGSAHQTSVRLADLDGAAAGTRAAAKARESAEAMDLEPGRYEVVLEPECVATLVIFLALYGFNAKQVLEGQSFVRLGEEQFDPAVDLWDDVTDRAAVGVPFDVEGTPKRRVDFVRGGVTGSLAHDRRTARKMEAESTGHAVPGGEVWGALPTNLFFGTGSERFDDLVAGVERGLLVTQFNYCRVLDPKTQVVTGLTRNGTFLIEGGEVTKPVTNLRFTQSFSKALGPGQVLGIGAESRFADSEFGPAFVTAPAIRLAEWNFTGGARG